MSRRGTGASSGSTGTEGRTIGGQIGVAVDIGIAELEERTSALVRNQTADSAITKPASSFAALPHELQLAIFSFLDPLELTNISTVSREWRRLTSDGSLWTEIDTRRYYDKITVETLERWMSWGGEFLKSLDLR